MRGVEIAKLTSLFPRINLGFRVTFPQVQLSTSDTALRCAWPPGLTIFSPGRRRPQRDSLPSHSHHSPSSSPVAQCLAFQFPVPSLPPARLGLLALHGWTSLGSALRGTYSHSTPSRGEVGVGDSAAPRPGSSRRRSAPRRAALPPTRRYAPPSQAFPLHGSHSQAAGWLAA